jgi:SET domain-containing protein
MLCEAKTKNNTSCKVVIVKDTSSRFCHHHRFDKSMTRNVSFDFATFRDGVTVRKTSLPDMRRDNLGLFTTRSFKKNDIITEYTGERISREEALDRRRLKRASHIRKVDFHQCIDGDKKPKSFQGIAQFTNDGTNHEGGNNSIFIDKFDHGQGQTRVFLKALRNIQAHKEIFVNYGNDYWLEEQTQKVSFCDSELDVTP